MDVFLGFSPGGRRQFGWSICADGPGELAMLTSGTADNAGDVMDAVLSHVPTDANIAAAGIGAPMFWSRS